MVLMEKDISWENLFNIIFYLKRNKCVVKNIFIVSLLLLGKWTSHEDLL